MATQTEMNTEEIEGASLDELRGAYEKALNKEVALVQELRNLANETEEAVDLDDDFLIGEVARRRIELPLKLAAVVRQRARLELQVAELELEEAREEREAVVREVVPLREAEQEARVRREQAEGYASDATFRVSQKQDRVRSLRDAVANAQNLKPSVLAERLVGGAS